MRSHTLHSTKARCSAHQNLELWIADLDIGQAQKEPPPQCDGHLGAAAFICSRNYEEPDDRRVGGQHLSLLYYSRINLKLCLALTAMEAVYYRECARMLFGRA